jgi:hypothetical protein
MSAERMLAIHFYIKAGFNQIQLERFSQSIDLFERFLLRTNCGYFDKMTVAPNSRVSDKSMRCSDWIIFEAKRDFVLDELNRLIVLGRSKQINHVKVGYSFVSTKDHKEIIAKKLKTNWDLIKN